jgi:uncharacterized membrane protein (UPF0182 family)
LSDLTSDSLSNSGRTAKQPNDKINYIRNSVKITVDAYNGTVKLYQWDDSDPVLKTWMKVFPGVIQPKSAMPASIQAHVRYPQDLFEVQRSLIGTYHVDDPVQFYNVTDKWTVPTDPTDATSNQPPYYVLASPPSGSSQAAEFQLTSPLKVNNRPYLAAYVSADSDPGADYGKMSVLRLPTNSQIKGPEQISNIFNTNGVITKDLSLFNTQGSQVVHGNLLTLPIGNTFLYVEPLYIQGTSGSGTFPTLQRVLVVYGDKIGYATNLSGAIKNLDEGVVGQSINLGSTSNNPTSTPTGTSPPASSSPPVSNPPVTGTNVNSILSQLDQAMTTLEDAYKSGDFSKIGAAQADVQRLTQAYLAARGASSTSPGKTPTPSPTRS